MAKLVEILARELGEWPEDTRIISFMKGWFVRENMRREVMYLRPVPGGVYPTDYATAIVTREMWEAERAKVKGKTEWNGEGLPPVGAVCEYHNKDNEWLVCEVVAHRNNAAVVLDAHYQAELVTRQDFRPIRTQEKIAEQERADAVKAMASSLYDHAIENSLPMSEVGAASLAIMMYEGGYRKQEKSE